MMAPEPLRSALNTLGTDDTSLALPSDSKLNSGPQRVLDQVHTIKRSKSKHGKDARVPSPTSPIPQTLGKYGEFGAFKFSPIKSKGSLNYKPSTTSSSQNKSINYQRSRSLNSKTMFGRKITSSSTSWDQQINTSNLPKSPNGLTPSRSDPALAPKVYTLPPGQSVIMRGNGQNGQSQQNILTRINRQSVNSVSNGTQLPTSQTRIVFPPSTQTDGRMGTIKTSKIEQQSATSLVSDLTLKEAIEYLSHHEEKYQQGGATFIQHATFKEEHTKQEVYELGGIPALVSLLRSPNPGVSRAAAGALRNLVYKHHNNKLEVQHCGGIGKSLQLLKETDSTDTMKQITGLLWNLSSADELKKELITVALPVLTENVVVPFTCWSDDTAINNIDPDVFHSATGCLRNLSCAKQNERQAMRECRGLIDSLMSYVQSCVAEDIPDDKSVENCTCILHNLTFQLETESPGCFSKFEPRTDDQEKSPTIGCFTPRSGKAQKQFTFDPAWGKPEDSKASGVNWLCHPTAMQTYLSLVGSSQNDATLQACCGALQNLTASNGVGSSAMSHILVQKLGALSHVSPLLKSSNHSLQKSVMSLLGNMSRNDGLQKTMAKQVLPELSRMLSSGPREMGNSDETISTACNTVRNLMGADTDISKKVINSGLVSSLADLSENGSFAKSSKSAALLLYSLWNEKNLQGIVKKLGISKSLFVNDSTIAVHKSLQVID